MSVGWLDVLYFFEGFNWKTIIDFVLSFSATIDGVL